MSYRQGVVKAEPAVGAMWQAWRLVLRCGHIEYRSIVKGRRAPGMVNCWTCEREVIARQLGGVTGQ